LADHGFDVTNNVAVDGASLDIPGLTKECEQLNAGKIEKTRNIANANTHVERVIGAVLQRFTILSATGVLSMDLIQTQTTDGVLLDAVVKVCCALNNLSSVNYLYL
jgi:hypothetical protein